MNKSELQQIIKEEILEAMAAPTPPTSSSRSVAGGSTSTLSTSLKGIGITDPNITNILGKLKDLKYIPSMKEKQIITDIFRKMMNTNDDTALAKVFNALKQMEAK
jgi:hypothetical protein